MVGASIVGRQYEPFAIEVEKGRIRAFARAIGETNPIHSDEAAARSAGYPSLVAPPTFAWTIIMDADQGFRVHADCGIPKAKTVHGQQGFIYHRPICAGDVISGRQTVVDFAEKKGGAMQFITVEMPLVNQRGEAVCDLKTVIVVLNA
jgi:acyl dehydratase